jgi:hypothetical protein
MTSIASMKASTASPGERLGPPIPSTASQKAPAPRPRMKRPGWMMPSEAAALAVIAAPRIGRLATSGMTWMRSVRARIVVRRVKVSRKRR